MYYQVRTFQFFLMCLSAYSISSTDNKCNKELSIDISDGEKVDEHFIDNNGIVYDDQNYFESNGKIHGCVCNLKKCIRKCCPRGQEIANKACQTSAFDFFGLLRQNFGKEFNEKLYFPISGFLNCSQKRYKTPENAGLRIASNGHLSYIETLDQLHYCLDYFAEFSHFSALVCIDDFKKVSIEQTIGTYTNNNYI